ncbi:MAG: hypothetical protein NZL89_07385 [Leptospiraceae bacterium]|nr:hypothetical protein [Leptospiraceae bacterium]
MLGRCASLPEKSQTIHRGLRVSVSSLVYGLILLWLKPARRALKRFFAINYYQEPSRWDPGRGIWSKNSSSGTGAR